MLFQNPPNPVSWADPLLNEMFNEATVNRDPLRRCLLARIKLLNSQAPTSYNNAPGRVNTYGTCGGLANKKLYLKKSQSRACHFSVSGGGGWQVVCSRFFIFG